MIMNLERNNFLKSEKTEWTASADQMRPKKSTELDK